MDVMETMRQRHSYRSFTDEAVDRGLLERILTAARLAPSAMNSQPWRFHVATGKTRAALLTTMQQTTVYLDDYLASMGEHEMIEMATKFAANLGNAPVIIAISVPRESNEMAEVNTLISAGAAIENLLLAATGYGLATCSLTSSYWVRDQIARILKLSTDDIVVSLVVVGHGAERPVAPPHEADVIVWHD
jgi:nitroreductase